MSSSTKENLLNLLDRPNEPIFLPKGDKKVVFNVPDDFLEDRFKGTGLVNRIQEGEKVQIKQIKLPDIGFALDIKKRDQFTLFLPFHRKIAGRLIDVFMGMRNVDDLLTMGCFARSRVNSMLFNYAFTCALLHRKDTKDIDIPQLSEFFPDRYVDRSVFVKAREEATSSDMLPTFQTVPIEIPLDYTGTDLDVEHRVAYFREDLGLNLHHWHWHLVYPFDGRIDIVRKDRRGEIFYYSHQQIIARYNFERFCNQLPRVTRLVDFREPIPEGYFPKLDNLTTSRAWAARPPGVSLKDINRPADRFKYDIAKADQWRNSIYQAIQSRKIVDRQGRTIDLDETRGIDILGNLIEANALSENQDIYGDLHNSLHILISLAHDPDHRHLENFGIIGDTAVNIRDPVFYRLHAFIDDLFQDFKRTLPPYTADQLNFSGMRVNGIEIRSQGYPANELNTFWRQNDVNMTRGLDFTPRSNVLVRFTHLHHEPFEYRIQVTNSGNQARMGTVRIFMAPKFDERGLPFLFTDQRKMMIELDKFFYNFNPRQNTVIQRSTASSVTIPFERTFRDLNAPPQTSQAVVNEFNYCGCGWPQHLLIPKGTIEGYPVTLFVMVSNYEDDRVDQPARANAQCTGAPAYCGVRDSLYPDKKAMGFPFDREPRPRADTLQDFLTNNMAIQDVTIKFNNRVLLPNETLSGRKPSGRN